MTDDRRNRVPDGTFFFPVNLHDRRSISRTAKRDRRLWQRRFWEHIIRNDQDYAAHMDYNHFNPVKHGLFAHAANWPYSSFHRAVRAGIYPIEWAVASAEPEHTGEACDGLRFALPTLHRP